MQVIEADSAIHGIESEGRFAGYEDFIAHAPIFVLLGVDGTQGIILGIDGDAFGAGRSLFLSSGPCLHLYPNPNVGTRPAVDSNAAIRASIHGQELAGRGAHGQVAGFAVSLHQLVVAPRAVFTVELELGLGRSLGGGPEDAA